MPALSATDPRFARAYERAQCALIDAVIRFELETGRKVDGIGLSKLNITRIGDKEPQYVMTADVSFLPLPGEVL